MPSGVKKNPITYCFIDASNLFYGGFKKLGWKIDYKLLADYLRKKYCVSKIFYYGGIETRETKFEYNPLKKFPILKFVNNVSPHLLQVDQSRERLFHTGEFTKYCKSSEGKISSTV